MRYPNETMIRALGTASVLLFLVSCRKGDRVPAYLKVDQVTVVPTSTQGSASHKVTALWVFSEDRAEGVWELPSRVPVLRSGTTGIKCIAGIRRNGISSDLIQYPFLATWSGSADLVPEAVTPVQPAFTYFDGLEFWIEAFEDPGYKFNVDATSDTTLLTLTDPVDVYEGNASGAFFLDTQHPFFLCSTNEDFTVPGNGPVFLEMDYRCDHRFLIGTYYTFNGLVVKEPYLFVAPTMQDDGTLAWNKIYIDISARFNTSGITDKEFYIEAQLDQGATSGRVYLDNIKLIHTD